MNKADAAALEAYPKRKDGRVRAFYCTDDDVRKVYAQGFRKAQKQCNGCFDRDEVYRQGLLKGAKEKEEEMMKQAEEIKINRDTLYDLKPLIHERYLYYKIGNKVKLIIIKDDD